MSCSGMVRGGLCAALWAYLKGETVEIGFSLPFSCDASRYLEIVMYSGQAGIGALAGVSIFG